MIDAPVSYVNANKFVKERKFNISVDPSLIVEEMIEMAADIVDTLLKRSWMVVEILPTSSYQFICSNNPVNIVRAQGSDNSIPKFDNFNSIVTFPLSPRMTLIGSYSPLPEHMFVDDKIVEGINWCTASGGATVLYGADQLPFPLFQSVFNLQEFHRLLPTRLLEHLP